MSYHILKLAGKDELDKKYSTLDSIGTVYKFVLIFPKLDAGIENIDIIEPDGFRWENVSIINPKGSVVSVASESANSVAPTSNETKPTAEHKEFSESGYVPIDKASTVQNESSRSNERREASIVELEAKAKKLKPKKSLEFSYDKFANSSMIATKNYNLVSGGESFVAELAVGLARQNGNYDTDIVTDLYLQVGVVFEGASLRVTPEHYGMAFGSTATSWQFVGEDKTLYLIIDGMRRQLEPIANKNKVGGSVYSGVRTSEALGYLISRSDLAFLANASSVELRLGHSKPRKLKKELLERIRNLLAITTL